MPQRVALLAALVEHRVRGGGRWGGCKRGAAGPRLPSFFFPLPKNPIFSFFLLTVIWGGSQRKKRTSERIKELSELMSAAYSECSQLSHSSCSHACRASSAGSSCSSIHSHTHTHTHVLPSHSSYSQHSQQHPSSSAVYAHASSAATSRSSIHAHSLTPSLPSHASYLAAAADRRCGAEECGSDVIVDARKALSMLEEALLSDTQQRDDGRRWDQQRRDEQRRRKVLATPTS